MLEIWDAIGYQYIDIVGETIPLWLLNEDSIIIKVSVILGYFVY